MGELGIYQEDENFTWVQYSKSPIDKVRVLKLKGHRPDEAGTSGVGVSMLG